MNFNRRTLITSAASLLAAPNLLQAKSMTRSEEQTAARAAAKMVAEETGEKSHNAAGAILTLPPHIPLLDGKTLHSQNFANKVVMLYFWASWCPICKVVGPQLQEFWQAHRNQGIELIGIATQDAPQKTKAAIEQRRYTFPVAMSADMHLPAALKTRSLPTVMLRSKLGVIVTVEEGDINSEEMKEFLVHL
jgi:thiol-disulfide isomerase/thioredoxin